MLVLTRYLGTSIKIFKKGNLKKPLITIDNLGYHGKQIKLGFSASNDYIILRDEIHDKILKGGEVVLKRVIKNVSGS